MPINRRWSTGRGEPDEAWELVTEHGDVGSPSAGLERANDRCAPGPVLGKGPQR